MPRGFSAAHDESASGTCRRVRVLARVPQAPRGHDQPDGERDDQRVQPDDPDEDPVDEAHAGAEAEAREDSERQPVVLPTLTPTIRFPPKEITPGVERSMPRLHDHEHLPERRNGENRHVGKDVCPRRMLERLGRDDRGDDREHGGGEPDRQEAGRDDGARDERLTGAVTARPSGRGDGEG